MELRSEGIYEEMHGYRAPKSAVYANDAAWRAAPIPKEVKGHQVWYRLAVGLLALLCALLLCIICGLYVKTTAEGHQLQMEVSSLKSVKAELQTNLTKERDRLHDQCNQLKLQHSKLQTNCDQLNVHNSQLQTSYNQLDLQHFQLQTSCNMTVEEKDNLRSRLCKLEMDVKQYAVEVTLDPDTANPYLYISADNKKVRDGANRFNRQDNPGRFNPSYSVLGKQGFSSGRFYYEVQVKGRTLWCLGVTRESSDRKRLLSKEMGPEYGYWRILALNGKACAVLIGRLFPLQLENNLQKVGVFVDYEAGLVSFYNADQWDLLYSFKHAFFNGTIHPFFSTGNSKEENSSPLIVTTPVSCNNQDSN